MSSDPNVTPVDPESVVPEADWGIDRLTQYVVSAYQTTTSIEASLAILTRRSVISAFRLGKALWLVRDQMKQIGSWGDWCEQHGVKRTTAYEYVQLFEKAKTEDAVKGMTLTQAKQFFGVSGTGKAKGKKVEPPAPKSPHKAPACDPARPLPLARLVLTTIDAAIESVTKQEVIEEDVEKLVAEIEAKTRLLIEAVRKLKTIPVPTAPSAEERARQGAA